MMDGALLVVGAMTLALVALLAVPVALAFEVEGEGPLRGQLEVRWLFGAVRFRTSIPNRRARVRSQRRRPDRAGRTRGRSGLIQAWREPALRRRGWRLAKDLVRAVHWQRLRLRVRLGLDDPADTGRLWAVAGPLSALAQNVRGAEIRIEPSFVDEVLAVDASGCVRVVPLRLLGLVAGFALSPAVLLAWHRGALRHA